ncbi:MAG: undecaprenyl-diphosphate phosphatase, partial [Rhizobiales bacterium]|nr:undecaprenyl-diphosphate phosphatase [Hyphomicrobiales bacterium]
PAVVAGLLFGGFIKAHLFHPVPVALAFIAGGIIILIVERRHRAYYGKRDLEGRRHARVESVDDMSAVDALKVGLVQCLALIPGTSRSGATIIGAMVFGFSRKAAAEFSFFLAVPTLSGATVYQLAKYGSDLTGRDLELIGIGSLAGFLTALVVVKLFVAVVTKIGFAPFAWYRIVIGIAGLAWLGLR